MRPGSSREPWSYAEFAGHVPSSRDHGGDYVSPRSVSNWCKGTALPDEIEPILRALFGSTDRHAAAREELRAAFIAAGDEKIAGIVGRARREPAGGNWVIDAEHDQFVLDRSVRPTDRRAAADPLREQLQRAIRDAAAELRRTTGRLANSRTWSGLPVAANGFCAIVDRQPEELPEWLGEAYALMLRLGRFIDTDRRVRDCRGSPDDPLDPDIHGALTDLVQLTAPWLRGFPSVAAWDDAAGRTLAPENLFRPAHNFARTARAMETIAERDAAEIEQLAAAADATDFLGQKAGGRLVGDAWNLLLALAAVQAASRTGTGIEATRPLVRRAAATLAAAREELKQLAASRPGDLREALEALAEEAPRNDVPPSTRSAVVPDDVEVRARNMILAARAPPAEWRPLVHRLNFVSTTLDRLDLLGPLSQLQLLNANNTQVADLAPIAALTGLQELYLTSTRVADLAPLAGLSGLQTLWLNSTQVADLAPLAGLSGLQELWLNSTQVADLAPLAGLSGLQAISLAGTPVADLAPLAGLSGLQDLYLDRTPVADLAPLAGLSELRFLFLNGTKVADLAPLAGLNRLQFLSLNRTPVADLAPLAGLTGLQDLHLDRTPVADLAPLAGLTGLQTLYLSSTPVADLAPLAGLTGLQTLYLSEGQEVDVLPLAGLKDLKILRLSGEEPAEAAPETGGFSG